jgi:hypothetical protein
MIPLTFDFARCLRMKPISARAFRSARLPFVNVLGRAGHVIGNLEILEHGTCLGLRSLADATNPFSFFVEARRECHRKPDDILVPANGRG